MIARGQMNPPLGDANMLGFSADLVSCVRRKTQKNVEPNCNNCNSGNDLSTRAQLLTFGLVRIYWSQVKGTLGNSTYTSKY